MVGRRGGVAERLVSAAGLPLETIDVAAIELRQAGSVIRGAVKVPKAVVAASRLIRRLNPDVVVATGGYVCVPVVVAARLHRVPVVLLEQNALPGRAVRLLSRLAAVVAASFDRTVDLLPGARTVCTGNPVRLEVLAQRGTLGSSCRRVLIMGGSQGARRINQAIAGCAGRLLAAHPGLTITHQCGVPDANAMAALASDLPSSLRSAYTVAPFFDDMPARIADADLVVMRAGGSSLAEVAALGRPMILVPYPHAGGHQLHNAEPYARAGAAVLIADEACTSDRIHDEIACLYDDHDRWQSMAAASRDAGRPDAADRVVELVRRAAA